MKSRHNDLFKMPNRVFDAPLSANELRVLAVVYSLRSRCIRNGKKLVSVNQKTIASLSGLKTTKAVSNAMNTLCRLGFIERMDRYYSGYRRLDKYVYTIPVIKGRDFFFVNRKYLKLKLTAAQTRMYLYFCKCADSRSKRFWNSYNDICLTLNLKRSAVIKTVSELILLGLIKKYSVKKKDGSYSDNHYKVIALKPPRIRRKRKRRSRLALDFSHANITCVYSSIKYILNHKSKKVNTLRIYFFDLRGSPKIFSTVYSTHFYTNRKRKRFKLYSKYRVNLGRSDFFNRIAAPANDRKKSVQIKKNCRRRRLSSANPRRAEKPHKT